MKGGVLNKQKDGENNVRDWYDNWRTHPKFLNFDDKMYYPSWLSKQLGATPKPRIDTFEPTVDSGLEGVAMTDMTKRGGVNNRYKSVDANFKDWNDNWRVDDKDVSFDDNLYYPSGLSKRLGYSVEPRSGYHIEPIQTQSIGPIFPIEPRDKPAYKPTDLDQKYDSTPTLEYEDKRYYSMIVSHNSRIQCLLAKIGHRPGQKIRFQNGCVLKIEVSQKKIAVSLLYSGDTKNTGNSDYYVTKARRDRIFRDSNSITIRNHYILFPDNKYDMDTRMGLPSSFPATYVFYIVRHGQSEHNEDWKLKLLHYKLDTRLTQNGISTLQTAARRIKSDIENSIGEGKTPTINCFVSDLLRSRQTLDIMAKEIKYAKEPIVLPCASEVGSVGTNGDCDSTGFWNKMARENYPACTLEQLNTTPDCKADWDVYKEFYGQQMRGKSDARMRCRDTNMLAMAIYILSFKEKTLEEFIHSIHSHVIEQPEQIIPRPEPSRIQPESRPQETTPRRGLFGWFGGKMKRNRTRRRGKKWSGQTCATNKTKRMKNPCCRTYSKKRPRRQKTRN